MIHIFLLMLQLFLVSDIQRKLQYNKIKTKSKSVRKICKFKLRNPTQSIVSNRVLWLYNSKKE